MEGSRRNFVNKRSQPQFKRTGGPIKRRERNSPREESEAFHLSKTVYRILCQSKKIGSVIGRGGDIVRALREETQAKITVSDSVPGSDERVISIFSPSDKYGKTRRGRDNERRYGSMEPHCAAQDALLKVFDKIVKEEILGADNRSRDETVVTARLLVSNNTVGCILGKKGDVIQRLRSETGANIRILPVEHLPACAMSGDELVQISGKAAITKKTLYKISTLLHQNPRKDAPPLQFSSHASQGFDLPGPPIRNDHPTENSAWLERSANAHRMHPMACKGDYGIDPSGLGPEDFNGSTPPHERDVASEFTMKMLCPADRIGGVIGKGGSSVRQLERDTGASILVEDVSRESYEKVIRVSSFEVLRDQRSHTIDAILYLQDKTSEVSDQGTITTRLLVSSNTVGCILGQGGHIINDMRRRINADIRIFSRDNKPKCALDDEELIQICGSFGMAKDALIEIASRLRTRCLRDANSKGEPAPARPLPRYCPTEDLYSGGFPPLNTARAGSSVSYEHMRGFFHDIEPPSFPSPNTTHGTVRDFELPSFPALSHATQGRACNFEQPGFPTPLHTTRYQDINEAKIASVSAMEGVHWTEEVAGVRMRMSGRDPYPDPYLSDLSRRELFSAPQNTYFAAAASSPERNIYERPGLSLHQGQSYNFYNNRGAYEDSSAASPVAYETAACSGTRHDDMYQRMGMRMKMRAEYGS
ncbi:KH domain-containing protein At4g18375-like [Andrographis paniculata]|uniref:KH domain-containing protein At4g18375-like n=1 Tax=Andrographis paniculata TaxID=175694 RepID=UPI0021E7E646|nr:KH domain-containing protein At4g18375-like [Andrographis paniculata]XP_051117527.1 KH domain-containing protein At4g18375-like [Andrographis paniculata]XP_051117528.1 KH domain-containing protein At4g18375-like [Andrographis paniculata]